MKSGNSCFTRAPATAADDDNGRDDIIIFINVIITGLFLCQIVFNNMCWKCRIYFIFPENVV